MLASGNDVGPPVVAASRRSGGFSGRCKAGSPAGLPALSVERVVDVAVFESLRPEWNELLAASASDCIFLTWEWLFTWWKHLAEDRHLAILIVRRGRELIAIAPFALRPRSISHARVLPVLEFLGSGFAGSDYLDVIARKGCESEVSKTLAAHLGHQRHALKWSNLKACESVAAEVVESLSENGWAAAETTINTCPFIPLSGRTWEAYLASLSAEHRANFNRKWRRLDRDYTVRFEPVRTTEHCREAIDLLIAQHNTRWRDRGGSDAFHTASLVAFHREFTQLALQRGWLRLYQLRLNEKPAASLYGLLYRRTFYFYQSSFDAAYAPASVGLIAMGLAIRSAIDEGAEEYDLLHGTEAYKSHWSRRSRELTRLEAFPPSGLGSFTRWTVQLGRAARAWARRSQVRKTAV